MRYLAILASLTLASAGVLHFKPHDLKGVECPDGVSECPTGNTCCLKEPGKYGCCPLPNAVCCPDKVHCCPSDAKCDASHKICIRKDGATLPLSKKSEAFKKDVPKVFTMQKTNIFEADMKNTRVKHISWRKVMDAKSTGGPGGVMCPDKTSECRNGETCCLKTDKRQYGCCGFPDAVCCSDGIHCCPSGFKCDLQKSECVSTAPHKPLPSKLISEVVRQPSKLISEVVRQPVKNVPCPGAEYSCPDGQTCCKLKSGSYGCCPRPKAVCCSDGVHCCPEGYTCVVSSGQCKKGESIIDWMEKLEALKTSVGIACPDKHECKAGETCCKSSATGYGCCGMSRAVCCPDMKHCCPSGYKCEPSGGFCSRNYGIVGWMEKLKPVQNVVCPDGKSECKSGQTCCKTSSGYGCCPQPNAVCCTDMKHCCPSGYTCNTAGGTCHRGNEVMEWLEKLESIKSADVTCPDGSSCKSGQTCCKTSSGYGCCPRPNAVCCADMKHCCPSGYTCNTAGGTCHRGNEIIEWLEKLESMKSDDDTCPDGSHCSGGQTCCKTSSGYGCCPQPNAVCCSDMKHCCPTGYTCNTAGGTCHHGNEVIEWLEKLESIKSADVTCPDGSSCKSGQTCCKTSSGYGCCPRPNAVCCSDMKHCCPSGYQCNSGRCEKDDSSIEWLEKLESIKSADVTCPDGSSCKSGQTCCKTSSGYGCCPRPNAVCCADMKHCCPSGYTCNTAGGTCHRGNEVMEWLEKLESIKSADVTCPDGSSCKSGQTCCKTSSGYGCCPRPNAVCCSDMKHCCPSGYQCNSGRCEKGDSSIEWLEKLESIKLADVTCPDGSSCKSGQTCCKTSSGYGCCPRPNAVCCSDMKHCCPSGYQCNSGRCEKGDSSIEWLEKVESIKSADVTCPDGSSCKSGQTCCKTSSGYGCCPRPNAVCCSDMKHCCPSGYQCNSGRCEKGDSSIEWLEKLESIKSADVTCPDGSSCKSGQTCCKTSSGYGCCPRPNAVCCADMKHCCPSGYTCNTAGGTCHRGIEVMEWLQKLESIKSADVTCPDGSSCKSGQTCCKTSSGYGCCPRPNAVCCSDMKHCCPSGYQCNSGRCEKGDSSIEWLEKLESIKSADVTCPDGSSCKSGQTCCKTSSGYGCCPRPNAVCCSDMKHCCPSGYQCNSGRCEKGDSSIEWLEKLESIKSADVTCPDGSSCKSGQTCCKTSSGYGCCPRPNAVCCSDMKHCCPSGYQCNSGRCEKGDSSIEWLEKLESIKSADVTCPDGSSCKTGQTCCKTSSGYGCCPRPNVVCCSDMKHCCPSGYTCNTAGGTCHRGNEVMEWLEKLESIKSADVTCPDGSSCKSGQTCCKTSSGYGCCPRPNAVCCSDMKHCCPSGYQCNSGRCEKGDSSIEWLEKLESFKSADVTCPDGSSCKSGQTCCKTSSGYGCCPRPNAVCCSDMKHCCPSGYQCNSGRCEKGDSSIEWLEKLESIKSADVTCPDGSSCKSGQTCCKTSSGYGCCPRPNAVCCSDMKHCCPSGYQCNSGRCEKGDSSIEWLEKLESIKSADVTCPDGSSCKTGQTCCKTSSGYGCCPRPNVVCCSDMKHCCPSGYTCNTAGGTCHRGNEVMEWLEKLESIKSADVTCPDGSSCKSGQTCCKTSSGYGCCPRPNAVCCSDMKHCCPSGYQCNSGRCEKGDSSIEWLEKLESFKSADVTCPDGSSCKSGQTCCKTSSGYGCCPRPNAVCCSDMKHCCPSGYQCNSGRCEKGDSSIEWLEKLESIKSADVTCPDGSSCKSGQTCCKTSSGYGCCPRPNAVCCSDMKHCCPSGYQCNSGRCEKGDSSIEWLEKLESIKSADVTCPDGSSCKTGQTCCKTSSGYGCCPRPNVVCCSDMKHCCPSGYTCNTAGGTCHRGNEVMEWLEKLESIKSADVTCPDGSSCKSGQTCCKTSSGYGCCPRPNAVCCSDMKHCCPSGYQCNSGRCEKGDSSIEWLEKLESFKSADVTCPDGSSCKSGQTCCKTSSGYGCCPRPNAVCCSDMKHCCPSGYTCNTAGGTCHRGNEVMEWLEKLESIKSADVTCPDGSSCKTGQTCCKTSSGYGCCPRPNAVCCSDMKHCCPSGYQCNSGRCEKGDSSIEWLEKLESIKSADVTCPDGSSCKSGQTCCKTSSGYGCCPRPNAVCCSDMKHCCPSGYQCNSGRCEKGDSSIEWLEKLESIKSADVTCPDGSSCKSGQTCCKTSSGYGCCPRPNAVCCSDMKHCCPSGYQCSSGRCEKGDSSIEWLEKLESIKSADVTCPDGSSCKSGQTCCKTSSGYGCCPEPNAVCCSDMKHCCPSGYQCNSGRCEKGDSSIEWLEKLESIKSADVTCPDGSSCKSGQTCCKTSSGYGCCPRPNAVCCSDMKHCCPSGYQCNSGRCEKDDSSIEWLEKLESIKLADVTCPDGSSCKSGQTCCKTSSGYGCCPRPNAVCCSDMKHCCPSGYQCSSGRCEKGDSSIEWLEKLESIKSADVTCPDGSSCKSKQTCCKTSSGYGCCPEPNAVCCSDMKHCCPSGYQCNSGRCEKGDSSIEWLEKLESIKSADVTCPDGSSCKSGQTCCKTSSGYGCCPRPNAVCCSDMKHCCPSGYQCNSGRCEKGDRSIEWLEKLESIKSTYVTCPDGSACQDRQTCCVNTSGNYGCCPIPYAICCSDREHCCPSGYTCSGGKCVAGEHSIEWFEKVAPIKSADVTCPDGSSCKSGQTCCKTSSGYGCCPRPNAVCCADMKHCCPSGYTCNTAGGTCHRGKEVIEWLEKLESIKSADVTCPDGSSCKSKQTCCKTSSGYGCCPEPNAVCCSDMKHCCPEGTTCDTASGKCKRGNETFEWLKKVESIKLPQKLESPQNVTNTCCGNTTCCPYSGAKCCTNANYCCPKDYICDEVPFCCRDPDGKSKSRSPYYNMLVKQMAKKMGVTLIGPE